MAFEKIAISTPKRMDGDVVRVGSSVNQNKTGDERGGRPIVSIRLSPAVARQLGIHRPTNGIRRRVTMLVGTGSDHGRLMIQPADADTPGSLGVDVSKNGTVALLTNRLDLRNVKLKASDAHNVSVNLRASPPYVTFDVPRDLVA